MISAATHVYPEDTFISACSASNTGSLVHSVVSHLVNEAVTFQFVPLSLRSVSDMSRMMRTMPIRHVYSGLCRRR